MASSVGKVKALLETTSQDTEDDWSRLQEEMMSILRIANPAKLRARIISLGREYPVDQLINHVYLPVRQRLVLDHNTSRIMSSMFDGALIEYAATSLFEMRRKPGKEAILMAWNVEERARLWLRSVGVYHCQDGTFLFLLIPLNRRARNCSRRKH